ncbi:MAG: response regulator [Bacteroidia bacterium]
MLKRYFREIAQPKVVFGRSDEESKRLLLVHRAMLVTLLLSSFFFLLQTTSGLGDGIIRNSIFIAIYALSLTTFRLGEFSLSRNIFTLAINIDLLFTNYELGTECGTFLFFFPVAIGTFFMFRETEKKQLIAFSLLPIFLMIASQFNPTTHHISHLPDGATRSIHFILSITLSTLATLYLTKYYTNLYIASKGTNQRQRARLISVFENIHDEIWMIDREFNLIEFNSAFEKTLKVAYNIDLEDKAQLRKALKYLRKEHPEVNMMANYERAIKGEEFEIEFSTNLNNKTIYREIRFKPIHEGSEVTGVVVTSKDITERRRQELSLKKNLEEKKTLAMVVKTIQHDIIITDKDSKIEWCNPYFELHTGYNLREVKEKSLTEILCGSLTEKQLISQIETKSHQGKPVSLETVFYKKSNEPFWCLINSAPVYNENNEHINNVIICIDTTERKRSEEQLQLLLSHAQKLNKQLANRDLELQKNIRLLNKQSWELQVSQQDLQKNQQDLLKANEELTEFAFRLQKTNNDIQQKNEELELARRSISLKADQLEQASKYKSEFLANMSHELRTPLNSIIILSRLLAENKDENLTRKQLEFAHVVHKSGSDLLTLINDILDLSKIEAGKIEIEKTLIHTSELGNETINGLRQLAQEKNIQLEFNAPSPAESLIHTDQLRLSQILKNLLSNAIKFTHKGGNVSLTIQHHPNNTISFAVTDNGIGIPLDKQKLIFESFKQVDGSISRRFGGTGLGLSISKELTHLLGGEISVKSKEGSGSTFSITLPTGIEGNAITGASSKTVLIIEDDPTFAGLLEKRALKEGFKAEICHRGDTGYMRACQIRPDAILLDINLPGIDGINLLKRLKQNQEISHIPVHIVSASKEIPDLEEKQFVSWIEKPVSSEKLTGIFKELRLNLSSTNKVLVIEDSPEQSLVIKQLLNRQGIQCEVAETGKDGTGKLGNGTFDCIILDLNLPDSDGMKLLQEFKEDPRYSQIPVIVYSSRELTDSEKKFLRDYASAYINKSSQALDSLLEETELFLQSVKEQRDRRKVFTSLPKEGGKLTGKKILVVDDDQRNIYALSSMLEIYGIEIGTAESGEKAIDYLKAHPNTDAVLMDIMMPGMDGYEATKRIRSYENLKNIPIVAVTAKAMKGDREISISRGLNEHITKPIDGTSLLQLLNNFFQ